MDAATISLYINLAVQVIEGGKRIWDMLNADKLTNEEIDAIERGANDESARRKSEREAMGQPSGGG